jgi:hypothetical protein
MDKLSIRRATDQELPIGMNLDKGYPAWLNKNSLTREFYHTRHEMGNLPAFVQIPLYVSYGIGKHSQGKICMSDHGGQIDSEDSDLAEISLERLVVTVPLPQVSMETGIKSMAASLKRERDKIMAEAYKKCAGIDERLSQLLAIEHKGDDCNG